MDFLLIFNVDGRTLLAMVVLIGVVSPSSDV